MIFSQQNGIKLTGNKEQIHVATFLICLIQMAYTILYSVYIYMCKYTIHIYKIMVTLDETKNYHKIAAVKSKIKCPKLLFVL